MSENTPLDVRMKRYEHTYRYELPRRAYTLLRLDGVAFHTYLKHAEKPFDRSFMNDMDLTALRLCDMVQGVKLAYVQSDEISLLLTDFDSLQSEPWYAGRVQKTCSVAAGIASSYFSSLRRIVPGMPFFDACVWSMSDPVEVANYFVWRQRDAVRNSVQMVGQHYFTQKQLHGVSCDGVQEMLLKKHGVNWNDFPVGCKQGRVAVHTQEEGWCLFGAPRLQAATGSFLAWHIPSLPHLE